MVKILIPRSNSISAKTIVPTDFEKYFDDVVNDYIISGFTVTATTGTNRSVDVSTGTGRVKGMFVSNDALETTAHTFGTDNTHYLYIQLTRDAYSEPESWSYTSNTTGTAPTDSIIIAKVITAAGDVSSIDQTYEFKKMSHLHGFVGTGDEIIALTSPYAGMIVSCTKNGSGFLAGSQYSRNAGNTAWTKISSTGNFYFGDGFDSDLTVSSGTTTLTETKYYDNVTVSVGATLTANNPMLIFVKGTLTVNGTISMNGKGSAGGAAGVASAGTGGAGGGASPSGGPGTNGSVGVASVYTNAADGTAGNLGILGGSGGASTYRSGAGGAGGNGGGSPSPSGTVGVGAAGGAGVGPATSPAASSGAAGTLNRAIHNPFDWISTSPRPIYTGAGGGGGNSSARGGGGGGGGNSFANGGGGTGGAGAIGGGAGGAGGAAGGFLVIFANSIVIGSSGIISSNGAAGSNGANNPGSQLDGTAGGVGANGAPQGSGGGGGGGGAPANGGSGGGGGSGGAIILSYRFFSNAGSSNIIMTGGGAGSAGTGYPGSHGVGGAGGAGGPSGGGTGTSGTPAGPGTGAAGSAGSAGADGLLIQMEL